MYSTASTTVAANKRIKVRRATGADCEGLGRTLDCLLSAIVVSCCACLGLFLAAALHTTNAGNKLLSLLFDDCICFSLTIIISTFC